jgi:hypothetical protein
MYTLKSNKPLALVQAQGLVVALIVEFTSKMEKPWS